MDKSKNYRNRSFYPMLAINLVMAVLFSFFYAWSLSNNRIQKFNNDIASNEEWAANSVDQFGQYMYNSHNIIGSYKTYIEGSNLSLSAALDYLAYWSDYYEKIELISFKDYSYIELLPGKSTYKMGSFANDSTVKAFLDDYDRNLSEDLIQTTNIFFIGESDEPVIGLCRKIRIQQSDYLLLFASKISTLLESGMSSSNASAGDLVLMDAGGSIMFSRSKAGTHYTGTNFFDAIEALAGQSAVEGEKSNLSLEGHSRLIFTSADGRECLCETRLVPHSDGWIMARIIETSTLGLDSQSLKISIFSTIFLLIWLFIDVIGYFRYNSSLKTSLRTIEEQNEQLAYASSAKTSFVSNMSHEIRTPINAVLGMDEMILRESKDPVILGYAQDIHSAGNVLLDIINDVLDFSKIEAGKLEIVPVEYTPAALVSDIHKLIKLKATAKYLSFDVEVAPDLPGRLYGDDIRLKQIIVNLLTNAVKYTTEGVVKFTLNYQRISDKEIMLRIEVKDSGIGIKDEDLHTLTEEFSRLDLKTNRGVEGTGLGMSIVCKLIDMMNGTLHVESTYGVGSIFTVTLPQTIINNAPVGFVDFDDVSVSGEEDGIYTQTIYAPDARILVIDDTPLNIKVVESLLKDSGITIDTASSGMRGLKMSETFDYDLILLDHRMPKMDGIETVHRMREEEKAKGKRTPIIVLTANVVSGAKEMYISEGFDDFISKPISPRALDSILERYLPTEKVSRRTI